MRRVLSLEMCCRARSPSDRSAGLLRIDQFATDVPFSYAEPARSKAVFHGGVRPAPIAFSPVRVVPTGVSDSLKKSLVEFAAHGWKVRVGSGEATRGVRSC